MKQFWFRRKVNPPPAATRIKAGDFLKCVQILRENNLCFPPPILEPKSAFEDGRSFIKFLEKKGFKAIGIGHYSTVLAKDKSTRVIKISRTPDNWISYITWALTTVTLEPLHLRSIPISTSKGRSLRSMWLSLNGWIRLFTM